MSKIITSFASAIIVIGCMQQEQVTPQEDSLSPVFTASFEDDMSKTYWESGRKLLWTADDCLSIFTNSYNQQYRYCGEGEKTNADFEEVQTSGFHSGNTINTNYAVYPYISSTEISNDGIISVNLPSVQSYAENSSGLGANTMVAVTASSSDYFLPFKNLCGYLLLKFYGEGTIRSISLKGNTREKIAGLATIVARYGEVPITSMSESATDEITLDCGESGVALSSTSEDATEFWFCIPPVTFSKGFTVTLTSTDGCSLVKTISSSKTITRNVVNTMQAQVELIPQYVDLGLSVKWAMCNIGADTPEEYGRYFAWGDVVGQTMNDSGWSGGGFWTYPAYELDSDNNLKPEYDAAHVYFGGNWRMPTKAEYLELIDNCTSTWTSDYNGTRVSGKIFTSNKEGYTDKSVFIPAGGFGGENNLVNASYYGIYWSGTFYNDNKAWRLCFDSKDYCEMVSDIRRFGLPIRPVCGDFVPVTSITINESSINIARGRSSQLTVTYLPYNAASPYLKWSSSNESIATVSKTGLVTAVSEGTCTITVSTNNGLKDDCTITVDYAYEYVDLGLSVKWATCNVGALTPEEYGRYFAWGDVVGQTWNGSSWSGVGFTPYPAYELNSNNNLKSEYDAAHVILGGDWRMPTEAEYRELIDNCTSTWTNDYNGTEVSGRIFTSNKEGYTDKSIFLPAGGFGNYGYLDSPGSKGRYWSSTFYGGNTSWCFHFDSDRIFMDYNGYRHNGRSVRPVSE